MRRLNLGLAFLSMFLLGACASLVAHQALVPPARAGGGGQKWEYKCEKLHPGFDEHRETMNELGLEGWKMTVHARVAGDIDYFCFMRPISG